MAMVSYIHSVPDILNLQMLSIVWQESMLILIILVM